MPRQLKAAVREGLRRLGDGWTFGLTGRRAAVLRYAASGEHELCEAAMRWAGSAEPLCLQLIRSGGAYEYRIRCERTHRYFFGLNAPINRDGVGPFVRIRAERGFAGAIASSLPAGSAAGLEPLHRFCVAICVALAEGRDRRASALATRFAQLAHPPC